MTGQTLIRVWSPHTTTHLIEYQVFAAHVNGCGAESASTVPPLAAKCILTPASSYWLTWVAMKIRRSLPSRADTLNLDVIAQLGASQ